ncbi:MAG: entericidin A/B family lipoprotein [Opitutales bacterium]|nr:entericidin A/B family lipoprotein [Opitutales bacterium]
METKLRNILALSLGVLALSLFVGCETMEGAGRDVQSAGEAIEDAAN